MLERWMRLCRYFPPMWQHILLTLPPEMIEDVREIRLRSGAAAQLTTDSGFIRLPFAVTKSEIETCFLNFCDRAVHVHQDELSNGFVTTTDGFRVGVAGHAVIKNGQVVSYRDLTSLCVRLSRAVTGCASPLLPYVLKDGKVHSLLLCGAPAVGKTTLLRDLAQSLSVDHRISVIDERNELAVEPLSSCDVITGCPKVKGILQAVRTLSPDAVIVDELGEETEWQAVAQSCYLGVSIIASAHIGSKEQALAKTALVSLIADGGLDMIAFLPPRYALNEATEIGKARGLLENGGNHFDRVYLRGHRSGGNISPKKRGGDMASMGKTARTSL